MMLAARLFCTVVFCLTIDYSSADVAAPYRLPTKCEVCKIFVYELKDRLAVLDKNKEVLRLGQGLDDSKKKVVNYQKSELKLIEAIHEPHICDEIKKYNVHAERVGSLRYAKGMSETMSTLHGLKNKGVKVELGIPDELWDAPNAEVGQMTRECYGIVEDHEDDIDEWYFSDVDLDPIEHLCRVKILDSKDTGCLDETWTGKERIDGSSEDSTEEDNKKAKGESGKPGTSKTNTKAKNKSKKKQKNDDEL